MAEESCLKKTLAKSPKVHLFQHYKKSLLYLGIYQFENEKSSNLFETTGDKFKI